MLRQRKPNTSGCTIVELLIVIVVIGILAAITIVAYNGIQKRATETVLKSDLGQAARQLEVARTTDETYPEGNGGDGKSAGLKTSGKTEFQFTSDGNSYCLTGTAGQNIPAYMVTNENNVPHEGVCPGHNSPGDDTDDEETEPSYATDPTGCYGAIGGTLVGAFNRSQINDQYCPTKDITVPSSINGYPITEIANGAFGGAGYDNLEQHMVNVETIVFPSTLKTIRTGAISYHRLGGYKDTVITFPAGMERIERAPFYPQTPPSYSVTIRIPESTVLVQGNNPADTFGGLATVVRY